MFGHWIVQEPQEVITGDDEQEVSLTQVIGFRYLPSEAWLKLSTTRDVDVRYEKGDIVQAYTYYQRGFVYDSEDKPLLINDP